MASGGKRTGSGRKARGKRGAKDYAIACRISEVSKERLDKLKEIGFDLSEATELMIEQTSYELGLISRDELA